MPRVLHEHAYRLEFGDEPVEYLPDDYSKAQSWLMQTVQELGRDGTLPAWRSQALEVSVENMPRAGFSFVVDGIGLIKAERIKWNG